MLEYRSWQLNHCKKDGVPTLMLTLDISNHPIYSSRRFYTYVSVDVFFFLGGEVVDLVGRIIGTSYNVVKQVRYEG